MNRVHHMYIALKWVIIQDVLRLENCHNLFIRFEIGECIQKYASVPPGLRMRAISGNDFSCLNQCAACPEVAMSTLLLGMKVKSSADATL